MINLDIPTITANAVVVVPIIVAIVQAIKMTGKVPNQFAPLASIAVGVVIGFLAHHNSADLTSTILSGAMYGLMASGLYSGVKTTIQNQPQNGSQGQPNSGSSGQNTIPTTSQSKVVKTKTTSTKSVQDDDDCLD